MLYTEHGSEQAGLFSAVSSAFIIDVQSNLQPDPNEMTATYLRILIHSMNNSLFPDADPSSAIWTGPPPEIVTVQSLLYASLATSLFAAFIAMLGKQWVSRYLRKQGGSAAEKSRDRQRKFEGFKEWYFQLAIESLPVMLQLALLLLGGALTLYLWTISRTIAGIVLAFTLFGITSYAFFTLVATIRYNCPYQTPLSILIRTIIPRLVRISSTFVRSLRALTLPRPSTSPHSSVPSLPSTSSHPPTPLHPSIGIPGRLLGHILSGLHRGLQRFHCRSTIEEDAVQPVADVPTDRIFEDVPVNWEVCKGDSRCIWWVLDYTTDVDVILPTARFAADMTWYPEIAEIVSPHVLADLFFDCLLNGQVIPGKLEHASAIAMALASVLSTRLVVGLEDQALRELCRRIWRSLIDVYPYPSDSTCRLAMEVLATVVRPVERERERDIFGLSQLGGVNRSMVYHFPTTKKIWLSRVMLQHFWRRRCLNNLDTILLLHPFSFLEEGGMTDGDDTPPILRTSCFLAVAISLGLQIDSRYLYPPNTVYVSPFCFPCVWLIES